MSPMVYPFFTLSLFILGCYLVSEAWDFVRIRYVIYASRRTVRLIKHDLQRADLPQEDHDRLTQALDDLDNTLKTKIEAD